MPHAKTCIKCGGTIEEWLVDQYERLQDIADERRPGRARDTGPRFCGLCLGRAIGLIDPPDRGDGDTRRAALDAAHRQNDELAPWPSEMGAR